MRFQLQKRGKYLLLSTVMLCLVAAALLLLLRPEFLFKTSERQKAAESQEIRIGVGENTFLSLPLYLAESKGFLALEGLTAVFARADTQALAFEMLIEGRCDFLAAGPEAALQPIRLKKAAPVLHIARVASSTACFVLARVPAKTFAWPDLKGKIVIASPRAELRGLLFIRALKSNGLRPLLDGHIIHNLPQSSAAGVFQAGTSHYVLAAEPWAAKAEKEAGCIVVASLSAPARQTAASTLQVLAEYRDKKPQICQSLINALQAALSWIADHSPEEIAAAVTNYYPGVDEKTLLRAAGRSKNMGCWPLSVLLDEAALDEIQELMFLENELLAKAPLTATIDNTFAERAQAGKP